MTYAYQPHDGLDSPVDPMRCRASVLDGFRSSQCRFKARTTPDEKGYRWCRVHSPAAEQEREAKRNARFEQKKAQWDAAFEQRRLEREALAKAPALNEALRIASDGYYEIIHATSLGQAIEYAVRYAEMVRTALGGTN